jgi:predicted metalloprotease with PDZ domain
MSIGLSQRFFNLMDFSHRVWFSALLSVIGAGLSFAVEIPADLAADLSSEKFQTRQAAQGRLLQWARDQGEPATVELLRQNKEAEDPEVRERCLSVLKDIVNDEYLKDGKGYVGIKMGDEFANVPGDDKQRAVIRITQVMPESAAEIAGLEVNDLIVGLGSDVWYQEMASQPFGEKIRNLKPDTKIQLKILRDGAVKDVEVKLGRRPFYADNLFFQGDEEDMEAAEQEAKEAYFRKWLEQRKSRK